MMFNDDELTDLQKEAIEDCLTASELVEFLQIPVRDIVMSFEDRIIDNIEEVEELIGLKIDNNDND